MRLSKRILCSVCVAGLVFCVAYSGSLSYLQQKSGVTNKFTVGHNTSKIVEEFEKPPNLNPNTKIKKKVQVQNLGSVPCYVRVLVLPSSNPDAYRLETSGKVDDNWNGSAPWFHKGGWDNYYYYKRPIAVNELTSPLFNEITVLRDLNDLKPEDAQIIVYEETVQSAGYSNCYSAFEINPSTGN